MQQTPNAIPQGYAAVTPYLIVKNGAAAIEFYKKAFGAVERFRMEGPNGTIGHAELDFNGSVIMLSDGACAKSQSPDPIALGGTPVSILLYVEDVDTVYERAIEAGASSTHAVETKFYGDRSGSVTDPFGHQWTLATHVEDVTPEEMKRRAQQFMAAAV